MRQPARLPAQYLSSASLRFFSVQAPPIFKFPLETMCDPLLFTLYRNRLPESMFFATLAPKQWSVRQWGDFFKCVDCRPSNTKKIENILTIYRSRHNRITLLPHDDRFKQNLLFSAVKADNYELADSLLCTRQMGSRYSNTQVLFGSMSDPHLCNKEGENVADIELKKSVVNSDFLKSLIARDILPSEKNVRNAKKEVQQLVLTIKEELIGKNVNYQRKGAL